MARRVTAVAAARAAGCRIWSIRCDDVPKSDRPVGLRRRERFEGECVDVVTQEVRNGGIHQPVARQRSEAPKRLGNYFHAEVAVAAGGTGVAGVEVTFVLDG